MATAPQIGDWSDVISWPLIGLHAILMLDRKILSFGTDGQGNQGGFIYDVWDPVTGIHTTLPNFTPTDIFCAMQVIVPETGEILISVAMRGRTVTSTKECTTSIRSTIVI